MKKYLNRNVVTVIVVTVLFILANTLIEKYHVKTDLERLNDKAFDILWQNDSLVSQYGKIHELSTYNYKLSFNKDTLFFNSKINDFHELKGVYVESTNEIVF